MKFKPESVTHKVDREFSRWYSAESHDELGYYTHKVLITTWRQFPLFQTPSGVPKWRAKIVSPQNSALSGVYAGKTRKDATNAALHAFQRFLYELGMEG